MKQVRTSDKTHEKLIELLEARREKRPDQTHSLQSIMADLINTAHKRGVK